MIFNVNFKTLSSLIKSEFVSALNLSISKCTVQRQKPHFPNDVFRILVGGEYREIARNILVFLMQFSASCFCDFQLSSLTKSKCKTEGRGGVNQTRLRNDVHEGINKSHGHEFHTKMLAYTFERKYKVFSTRMG